MDPAVCRISWATASADDGALEVTAFLTDLAVTANVSASTQNRAFSALLFLYANVLGQPLGAMQAMRAQRPHKLPVVLTKDEVRRFLAQLEGTEWLRAMLLYGSGLGQ